MNVPSDIKSFNNKIAGRGTLKPVHFYFNDPEARTVRLIGDFNGWNPAAHPMTRQVDGSWFIEVLLAHGHHQYLFVVDGILTPDTHAMGAVRNERNELVSLIAVS